jgi:hypothetical protein
VKRKASDETQLSHLTLTLRLPMSRPIIGQAASQAFRARVGLVQRTGNLELNVVSM